MYQSTGNMPLLRNQTSSQNYSNKYHYSPSSFDHNQISYQKKESTATQMNSLKNAMGGNSSSAGKSLQTKLGKSGNYNAKEKHTNTLESN